MTERDRLHHRAFGDRISADNRETFTALLEPMPDPSGMALDPYLDQCVTVVQSNLDDEFGDLSANLARWNEVYVEAHYRSAMADLHVKRVRASRRIAIKNAGRIESKNTGVKLSEADIDDRVTIDPEVLLAEDVAAFADREKRRILGIVHAISKKGDGLVTIAANARKELGAPEGLRTRPKT